MGLSWQQSPLSQGAVGCFLVPEPLPDRLLYAEPLRRRMRVRFGGRWIADSDARLGAWSYREAFFEVGRISDLVSFDPDIVSVHLDGTQLRLEPGPTVIPHGPDRELAVAEAHSLIQDS